MTIPPSLHWPVLHPQLSGTFWVQLDRKAAPKARFSVEAVQNAHLGAGEFAAS
jgi:hypothetical protein